MPSTRSSAIPTTRPFRCCDAWSPPANWAGSPARGSTTTAAELVGRFGLPPCRWEFPDPSLADDAGLVCLGADLAPETVITAYASAIFPMPVGRRRLGWWSPDPRGVLPLDRFRVTRSLTRSSRRFETRIDTAFEAVIERCALTPRPHGWITRPMIDAYLTLHRLGVAHSVETWEGERLVGGLYGVGLGSLFAGESMFHDETDASKVALMRLVIELSEVPDARLDVQWTTPHLRTLGAVDVDRETYRRWVATAVEGPGPPVFRGR